VALFDIAGQHKCVRQARTDGAGFDIAALGCRPRAAKRVPIRKQFTRGVLLHRVDVPFLPCRGGNLLRKGTESGRAIAIDVDSAERVPDAAPAHYP
jgi:hypothetical protein